jgi:uncharacterized repeat protein (TIGR02059 family)
MSISLLRMRFSSWTGSPGSVLYLPPGGPPPDTTAPLKVSAVIPANGLTLTLTYNETLDAASTPLAGAFSLSGTSATVSSVLVSGSTVVLTLGTAVAQSATVTLSYTPGGAPIQDTAGNDAAALVATAVTNSSTVSGPTGTDFGALAVANGLGVVGYFRADFGLSGSSGSGLAAWANLAGAMSSITPHGSATNGIGTATAGLGGRAGLIQNGATQKGAYTAPVLAVPGTTNWHRYLIARQAAGGSGAARKVLSETGDAYKVEFASALQVYAYGCQSNGNLVTSDVWQRWRISCTGANTGEIKIGSQAVGTGGTGALNTAPDTARQFGDLPLGLEWLMYMELTGTKANFLTFAAAADAAAQSTWTNAIQI